MSTGLGSSNQPRKWFVGWRAIGIICKGDNHVGKRLRIVAFGHGIQDL
jgi:hypothetical protein